MVSIYQKAELQPFLFFIHTTSKATLNLIKMKTNLPTRISLSASEVKLHYKRPLFKTMVHVTCAEDAVYFLRKTIDPNEIDLLECFWVILLTNANRIITITKVASGTATGVQTNIKYILQLILLTASSALIIAHNHPSGNLKISKKDILETKKLQRLLKLIEVTLLDHIIITSESFVSFAQKREL